MPEGDLIFSLTFVSESKKLLQFSLRSTIVETQVDLIIGLPTIRQLNLLRHMPSQFFSGEVLTKMLTGLGPVEKTLRILEAKAERLYTLSSGSSHERSRYVSSRECRKTLPRSEHDLINHCVVSQSVTSYTPPNSMGRQEDVQYQRARSLRLCTLLPGSINQTKNSSLISTYDR